MNSLRFWIRSDWFFAILFCTGTAIAFNLIPEKENSLQPVSFWQELERLERQLESRTVDLKQLEEKSIELGNYRFNVKRLENVGKEQVFSRYILDCSVRMQEYKQDTWVQNGVRIGLVDHFPEDSQGKVQIVAIKRED